MQRRVILASTSSARRELMDALGIDYEAIAPGVDEVVPEGTSALGAVAILSERKARAVLEREPDALVIGADQLVTIDGQVLGKPADRDAARAQLSSLLGKTHEIVTGVSVMSAGFEEHVIDVARLTVYPLEAAELERYLDLEEWKGCAGGYRVEGAGQALFERIDGDRTSIQGLPMLEVVRLLRKAGVQLFARPAR